jgi:hypothetical protein
MFSATTCDAWRRDTFGFREAGECGFVSNPHFGEVHVEWASPDPKVRTIFVAARVGCGTLIGTGPLAAHIGKRNSRNGIQLFSQLVYLTYVDSCMLYCCTYVLRMCFNCCT